MLMLRGLNSLSGGGHVSLTNGVAYGEPYESAVAEMTVQRTEIEASSVVLKAHGVQIAGNGGYDWTTSICCASRRARYFVVEVRDG